MFADQGSSIGSLSIWACRILKSASVVASVLEITPCLGRRLMDACRSSDKNGCRPVLSFSSIVDFLTSFGPRSSGCASRQP